MRQYRLTTPTLLERRCYDNNPARWADLYRKFVAEAAYPDRLKERLAALESAIAVRLEALGDRADCQYERELKSFSRRSRTVGSVPPNDVGLSDFTVTGSELEHFI